MTRGEKIKELQEKAGDLVTWLEKSELPGGTFTVAPGENITNGQKYFETQKKILEAYKANPFSRAYVAAYYRLLNLKTYIQTQKNDYTGRN